MDFKTTEEFRKDIGKFDTCMLVTRDGEHLRSRPMAPKLDESDGTIRFLTSKKTHKTDETERSPQANAAFADHSAGDFISVSGPIRLSDDKADIDAIWTSAADIWLKEGKAEAVVLILEPQIAEYWDGQNTMKAGWEMIKGALSDRRPHPGDHGKVAL